MHLAFMASFYVAMHRKLCTLCHVNTPTWTYTNSWNIITGPGGWPRTVGHDLLTNRPMSVCKTAVLYYKNGDAIGIVLHTLHTPLLVMRTRLARPSVADAPTC